MKTYRVLVMAVITLVLVVIPLPLIEAQQVSQQEGRQGEQIVLIGHQGIPDTLHKDEIEQIFLGRKTRWADNTTIAFVVYNEKTALAEFLKEYLKKTPFQYQNYWKKQVFTGKGRMPKTFDHSADLMMFVSSTKGAMSFARASDVDTTQIKIVTVEP